jgi:hypothetical protein
VEVTQSDPLLEQESLRIRLGMIKISKLHMSLLTELTHQLIMLLSQQLRKTSITADFSKEEE